MSTTAVIIVVAIQHSPQAVPMLHAIRVKGACIMILLTSYHNKTEQLHLIIPNDINTTI